MNKIEIIPQKGIKIDNNLISFSFKKEELIKSIGDPEKEYTELGEEYLTYSNSCIQFGFKDNKMHYIELSYEIENTYLFGVKVFNTKVEKLVDFLTNEKKYRYDEINPEPGYTYIFKNLDLVLGRAAIPEEIEEDLGETDYQKGIYFASIGIGIKGTRS